VLNRAVARLTLFEKQEDYEAFERVLEETVVREALPIFSFTIVPNHWHFVVRPETDWQLSAFFRWLTHTHRNKKGGKQRGRSSLACSRTALERENKRTPI